MKGCTVCPFQKCDPRDPSRSDPTSRHSRTVQDRTCAARGIRSRRGILPCIFNMVSGWSTCRFSSRRMGHGTYQIFSMIVAPAGMKYPLYKSSSVARFGIPVGPGQLHRSNSLINAEMYGKSSRSESCGKRSFPTILSSSSCAFLTTWGCKAATRKKVSSTAWVCRCSRMTLDTDIRMTECLRNQTRLS